MTSPTIEMALNVRHEVLTLGSVNRKIRRSHHCAAAFSLQLLESARTKISLSSPFSFFLSREVKTQFNPLSGS